jgi:outer membrane protein, multidrug efflux system
MKSSLTRMLALLLLWWLASCKVAEKISDPALLKPPTSPQPTMDSLSMDAVVSWRTYFTDTCLNNYINEALTNNLDLKSAQQRILMAAAHARMARQTMLPTLQAATAVGQQRFGEYTMDGVGNFDTNFSENVSTDRRIPEHLPDYYLGFQSSWEVDVWGKLKNRKRAATARLMASEKARHLAMTLVVSQVAARYYRLLALDDKLKIIRENIQLQQVAVELIINQKEAGRATELAVKQFTAQLLNTQSLERLILQEIIKEENELNLLLGRYPQPIVRTPSLFEQRLPDALSKTWSSQILIHRPDVQAAEWQLAAARADVQAARAAYLPSLTFQSGIGVQAFTTNVLFDVPTSLTYQMLGNLTAPLFNRYAIKGEYRRAGAAQFEAFYDYQQTVIRAYQEVLTQRQRIDNLGTAYQFKSKEVEALLEGVATANDLFVTGFASYLEVITAQKSVLAAELDAIDMREQQFNATIDLYRVLGGGWQ